MKRIDICWPKALFSFPGFDYCTLHVDGDLGFVIYRTLIDFLFFKTVVKRSCVHLQKLHVLVLSLSAIFG